MKTLLRSRRYARLRNDNLFYTGGGRGSLYNAATGLGVPDLSALAADFRFRS